MLIRWDCPTEGLSLIDKAVIYEIVAELVRAYRRGHHLVVISRRVADWVLKLDGLSDLQKSTIIKIRQDYTQNANIHLALSCYINLVDSFTDAPSGDGTCINISMLTLKNSNICDKPKLLVENQSRDGWMYRFIMDNICDNFGYRNLAIDLTHGGGDDIAAVFEHNTSDRRVIFSIVDSDKHCPSSYASLKLHKLTNFLPKSGWPLAFVVCTPCREIENFIPLGLIAELPSGKNNLSNTILLNISIKEDGLNTPSNERYMRYFDYKEGWTSEKFDALSETERDWVSMKLTHAGFDAQKCVFSGYGSKVVDQIKSDNSHCSALRRHIRSSDWISAFGDFFQPVLSVFLSARPIVT